MRVLKGVLEGELTHAGTPLCSPWRAWKPSIAASAPSAFDGVKPIFDSAERGAAVDPAVPVAVPSGLSPPSALRVMCALRAHGRVELAGGGGGELAGGGGWSWWEGRRWGGAARTPSTNDCICACTAKRKHN
jgi:hypothetical protein